MKILAVCGMGIGTSIILKMNIDSALTELNIDADTEASDISAARGAAATADLVLTSEELVEQLGEVGTPIEVINDFTDIEEIKSAISRHF
ncbi:PTS sugar transporter subunit IIB [Arcanobacterium bovis]|uniref:PTS sugar transporter subunit IIB n=1 Tax=Arcanobacterium bovis TaxID=2529275 RepID=A0A4Q9UZZ7_9ACTO|nr:PTS sugar transporter subunit IIB [Arcanobacterium bovis]TBW21590.1 PTS sugar transporter subunit IIB [Arcanobacterium bovis]